MAVDTSIFKAYDIRGVYPSQLNEEVAKLIGAAFANIIQQEVGKTDITLVVSRDMRISSPALRDAVADGILSTGANVLDIGIASTPTFYFATGFKDVDGGIQVSASHNPSEWNGCKMVRRGGVPVSGDSGIMVIRDMVAGNQVTYSQNRGLESSDATILEELLAKQLAGRDVSQLKRFKIVADAANAMGSVDMNAFFSKVDAELIRVNFELDGTFPAHEADPLNEENMQQLHQEVLKHGADFGIAADGDGDRYFIVMDTGKTLAPEILRGILAGQVLKREPGANIGYDIRPGKITEDLILEAGGKPFITRVGHSLIKEQMIAMDSPFSGESSGHFFYKTQQGSFECPIIMLYEFFNWLSSHDQPLSKVVAPYFRYFHSGEINSVVDDKEAVFALLKSKYADATKFSDLDGVYFEYPDYWFNVRGSNTEPKMRLNLEARSQEVMETKREEVLALIRS